MLLMYGFIITNFQNCPVRNLVSSLQQWSIILFLRKGNYSYPLHVLCIDTSPPLVWKISIRLLGLSSGLASVWQNVFFFFCKWSNHLIEWIIFYTLAQMEDQLMFRFAFDCYISNFNSVNMLLPNFTIKLTYNRIETPRSLSSSFVCFSQPISNSEYTYSNSYFKNQADRKCDVVMCSVYEPYRLCHYE